MGRRRVRPAIRLEIDGKAASPELLRRLVSIRIVDHSGGSADTLEIELDDRNNAAAPPIGGEVKVWLGYEPKPAYRGRFRISGWSLNGPPAVMTVNAKAADFTSAIRAPKTRSHHQTTLGAIVSKVAGEHGLGVSMDSGLAARMIDHVDQQTESDMSFLSRLAKRNGATFKIGAGKVVFTANRSTILPDGTSKTRFAIRPEMISTWSFRAEERGAYKSAKAAFYDKKKGKRVHCTAGSGTPCHRDRRLYATQDEAQNAADANLGDLTRGKVTGSISGPGMPDLYAEALLDLAGFSPDCDGEYLAKTVTHRFDGRGYVVDIDFETIGSGGAD